MFSMIDLLHYYIIGLRETPQAIRETQKVYFNYCFDY